MMMTGARQPAPNWTLSTLSTQAPSFAKAQSDYPVCPESGMKVPQQRPLSARVVENRAHAKLQQRTPVIKGLRPTTLRTLNVRSSPLAQEIFKLKEDDGSGHLTARQLTIYYLVFIEKMARLTRFEIEHNFQYFQFTRSRLRAICISLCTQFVSHFEH